MPHSAPRPTLGPRLVECGNSREGIVGYLAGWVAEVDSAPVGFVRRTVQQARADLRAFAMTATPDGVVSGGNASGLLP